MKGNRKWIIALISIVLMTLVVGGGALAAEQWITSKETEVYQFRNVFTQAQDFINGSVVPVNIYEIVYDIKGQYEGSEYPFLGIRLTQGGKIIYVYKPDVVPEIGSVGVIKINARTFDRKVEPVDTGGAYPITTVLTAVDRSADERANYPNDYVKVKGYGYNSTSDYTGWVKVSDLPGGSGGTTPVDPPSTSQTSGYVYENGGSLATPYNGYGPGDIRVYTGLYTNNKIPLNLKASVVAVSDYDSNYLYVQLEDGNWILIRQADLHSIAYSSGGTTPSNPTPIGSGTIGSGGARVRATPSSSATEVHRFQSGTTVYYYTAPAGTGRDGWVYVGYTENGTLKFGWIRESDTTNNGGGTGQVGQIAYVVGGSLALRSAPNGSIIRYYPAGTAVSLTGLHSTSGWVNVKVISDGATGVMMTQYLSTSGSGGGGDEIQYAVVNNPAASGYVNLRKEPDGNSAIVGRFYNGQQVIVLEYKSNWCRVQIGAVEGYMATNLLSFSGDNGGGGGGSTTNPTSAVVNNPNPTDRLNLRASASTGSTSLGRYYNGTQVKILEYGTTWCYVEVQGIRGYMMSMYLSFDGTYTPPIDGGGSGTQLAVVKNPVSTQKLNLRAQPTTSSTSLGQFYNGTLVTVLRYGSEWCEVRVNGITGYMMTRYLSFSAGSGSGGGSSSSQYAVVKNPVASQKLNLRAEPSTTSRSLAQYYNGTSVKILEYGLEWCRVEVNGIKGYMMTRYLQFV